MLRRMDAAQALADLTEISSQVVQVVIQEADGALLATTIPDRATAERFLVSLARLLEEADSHSHGLVGGLCQLEASTLDGGVFVVRAGGRQIAATTRPDPTVGLVLYDLKRCLEGLDAAPQLAASANGAKGRGGARPARRGGPSCVDRSAPFCSRRASSPGRRSTAAAPPGASSASSSTAPTARWSRSPPAPPRSSGCSCWHATCSRSPLERGAARGRRARGRDP